jgi:hypothetical protein
MKDPYTDWLYHRLIAQRAEADPLALRRAILLVSAGLSTIGDGEPTKARFRAKIGSLEFVQALVSREPSLLDILQLPLQKTRSINATAAAETTDYVEAVVGALSGQLGVVLTDTHGNPYDVRFISLIGKQPPFPTVAFSRPGERGTIADDFRLQYLTLVGADIKRRLDADRAHLDMSLAERAQLAEILESQPAETRLRTLDELVRDRFTVYLYRVYSRLANGETYLEDLRPPRIEEALRYIGGEGDRVTALQERLPFDEVFGRLVTLPVALPEPLIKSFRGMSRSQRRTLLRHLQKLARSVFPVMHYLRLLLLEASTLETRQRVLRRLLGSLIAAAEIEPLIKYARWLLIEFERRPSGETLSAKLMSTWLTASNVCVLAHHAGVACEDVLEVLDLQGQPEMLLLGQEDFASPSSPIYLKPIEVGVRVLAHVFEEHADLRLGLDNLLTSTVLRSDSPWPIHIDLYPAFETVPDPIQSIFAEPMERVLERLLGDRFTHDIRASLTVNFAVDVIRTALKNEPAWWHFLRRRSAGGTPPYEVQEALIPHLLAGPDEALLATHPLEWCARVTTLAQALSKSRQSELVGFLKSSADVIESNADAESLAFTIIRAWGASVSHLPRREDRLPKIEECLEQLIGNKNRDVRAAAWRVALLVRDRLAASDISPRLSRIILLGRKMA